jgi:hypothetical protein
LLAAMASSSPWWPAVARSAVVLATVAVEGNPLLAALASGELAVLVASSPARGVEAVQVAPGCSPAEASRQFDELYLTLAR